MRWLNLIGSVQSTELHFVSRPGIKARIHTILGHVTRRVGNRIRPPVWIFKFLNRAKDQFECPLCNYKGPFMDLNGFAGFRRHARCPKCQSLERHRLQYLAVRDLLESMKPFEMKMLHVAPEPFLPHPSPCRSGPDGTGDPRMRSGEHE